MYSATHLCVDMRKWTSGSTIEALVDFLSILAVNVGDYSRKVPLLGLALVWTFAGSGS
jgi:hypothetical protein